MSVRDDVARAMLPVLFQHEPRAAPRALVARAFEFADAFMWHRAVDASEVPSLAPDTVGATEVVRPAGSETCVAPFHSHRWSGFADVCERCGMKATTPKQKQSARRARRTVERARVAVAVESLLKGETV